MKLDHLVYHNKIVHDKFKIRMGGTIVKYRNDNITTPEAQKPIGPNSIKLIFTPNEIITVHASVENNIAIFKYSANLNEPITVAGFIECLKATDEFIKKLISKHQQLTHIPISTLKKLITGSIIDVKMDNDNGISITYKYRLKNV